MFTKNVTLCHVPIMCHVNMGDTGPWVEGVVAL